MNIKELPGRIKEFITTNTVKRNVTFGVIGGVIVLTAAIAIPLSLRTCDHVWDNGITQTEATCTENGVKVLKCRKCRETKLEPIDAKGHSPKIGTVQTVTEATCKTEGKRRYTCERCGETVEEAIPVNDKHVYTETVTREATCKTDGEGTKTCSVCGKTERIVIPKTNDHKYEEKVTREPTCTKDGIKTLTCSVCGKQTEEKILAVGHDYEPGESVQPTCLDSGYKTEVCKNCGDVKKAETIPALEHEFTDATCTSPKRCKNCGITIDRALGHDAPDGITCRRCGCLSITFEYDIGSDGAPYFTAPGGLKCDLFNFDYVLTNEGGATKVTFRYNETFIEGESGSSCTYVIKFYPPDSNEAEIISVVRDGIVLNKQKMMTVTCDKALTVPGTYRLYVTSAG